MDAAGYERWVDRYVRAWSSNDPVEIGELFAEDCRYFTEPYASPWEGRDRVVREWLARKDKPGTTEFDYEILSADDALGIARGRTVYVSDGRHYDNLWEIRLDPDGRCREFVEWWMELPG